MFDLNPLTAISREIREWMEKIGRKREAWDQSIITALKSLSIAVLETRSYIRQTSSSNKERDSDRERELSALWNEAHVDLKLVDRDLAARCFAKAEYWTDPELWDAEKVRQYNITLDSMSDAVRSYLARRRRE